MKAVSYITILHGILMIFYSIKNILNQYHYNISVVRSFNNPYLVYGIWIFIGLIFIIAGIGSLKKRKYSYYLILILYLIVELSLVLEIVHIISNEFMFSILFCGVLMFLGYAMILDYVKKHKNYYYK
ncbi:hypothetical protein SAMN02745135_01716 [Caloranaerobacter azorensis DSM 13643]|uniref:Uncharacterized protein n=1 Tax=Caloranaerobacter azorensis DSM 13643 TaxID=1121264 RepID=A0A1M5V2V8_9FIRM|nr:hypothetical protein [Caloranaerobacter azorensis]SHH69565.1 hypothetical protein SAMN02745135_01716 [Caloranaerobacter azorensis DSM 13643]